MAARTMRQCFRSFNAANKVICLEDAGRFPQFGAISSVPVRRRNVSTTTPSAHVRAEQETETKQSTQSAEMLDGLVAAQDIRNSIKTEIADIRATNPNFIPGLAIVQVGNREDSNVYIRMKIKNAKEVGIYTQHVRLPRTTTEAELLSELSRLNHDESIHGVILQLPPDCENKIDAHLATNAIWPIKDVDGLTDVNAGKLARGDVDCIVPCTPLGCLDLIKRTGVSIRGSTAVVLGRSKIVGSPMADLLIWNDATVTKCHSRTRGLDEVCRQADILVAAVGRAEMVKRDWVKPGAVVIDCGINAIPDASKRSGQRLVGDVDFSQAAEVASFLTPVPGGVGPMTVALLLKNTLENAKRVA